MKQLGCLAIPTKRNLYDESQAITEIMFILKSFHMAYMIPQIPYRGSLRSNFQLPNYQPQTMANCDAWGQHQAVWYSTPVGPIIGITGITATQGCRTGLHRVDTFHCQLKKIKQSHCITPSSLYDAFFLTVPWVDFEEKEIWLRLNHENH